MHKKLLICICAVSALAAMGCNESKDWKKTPECGNQILEIGEECDTTTSKLCSNYDATKVWEESGRPGCNASCKLTIGTCVEKGSHIDTCGNNVLDAGEACDGSLFANSSESCETYLGTGATGRLTCVNCRVTTSSCVAPASCGNNELEGDEKCDGTNFGEETCASLVEGSTGGSLSCVACTTIDTSNCEMPNLCGNDEIDDGEECDGEEIGDVTCEDGKGEGATGTVSCDSKCKLVYTACRSADTPESCGDGNETIDDDEECDGSNLNDLTCTDLDDTLEGDLSCDADCHFVKSACTPINLCGNGVVDEGEDCDGDNLNEATCHSVDENLSGDGLKCNSECKFDLTGCMLDINHCGDGIINYGEECDINLSLEGHTCNEFDSETIGGAISCNDDCTFDKSECEYENPVVCGDDKVQGSEECDNDNFNGKTCADYAGAGATGDLVCDSCLINHDSCVAAPSCGDGVRNGSEECEGSDFGGKSCEDYAGSGATGDLVCESCVINHDACVAAPSCGDGVRNGSEECEGSDFGGKSCEDYAGSGATGDLVCESCVINHDACVAAVSCGDGIKNGDEACDGDDLGGAVCPEGTVGTPVCKSDCTLDTSVCAPATCNNNVLDEGEACDPSVVSYNGIACLVSNTNTSDLYNVGSISCSSACALVEDCTEKAAADFTVKKLFETYYGGLMTAKMSKFTNDTKKRQVTSRHADRGVTWNLATLTYDSDNFSMSFANWVAGTDGAPNFEKYIQVELLKLPESDVMEGDTLVTTPIGAKLISDYDYVAVKIDFKRASSTSPKNFALTLYDGSEFKAVLKNFGSENFSSFASTGEVTFSIKDMTNPIVRMNSYEKGGAVLFKNLEVRALNNK